jgi:hypothetical protein
MDDQRDAGQIPEHDVPLLKGTRLDGHLVMNADETQGQASPWLVYNATGSASGRRGE